ncbi:MAG: fructose-bisphosphatase class II [Myxococcales bacterium]|nr:fructose-bisphosphatase class II [Myxococcales bacterium]
MDRNLALEMVRVTERAALAAARWNGKGNKVAADQAAVDAMRSAFDSLAIRGRVVIGEGERDEAPMLYIGEEVGRWGDEDPEVDIALDPLEGTNLCAGGKPGALAVIATAPRGKLLHAPDSYMFKIACGPEGRGLISLAKSVTENLQLLAEAKRCDVSDLNVAILERPRHEDIVDEVRSSGAMVTLFTDGDVNFALATCKRDSGIDLFVSKGGAPEGVLAAVAMQCLGGDFQGQMAWRNETEKERALGMGFAAEDLDRVFSLQELAGADVMFSATGVTGGPMLRGVDFFGGGARSHSLVLRSTTGTVRFLETIHDFERRPFFPAPSE